MSLIPEAVIQQVIERCDIVELIASYVPLKKAGRNFKANCPFHHEKTPSFVVNPDKQIFHCFGCGVGGNVLSFVMKQERLEFPEAIRFLAQKVNVEIPTEKSFEGPNKNLRTDIYKINELAAQYYHKVLLFDKSTAAKKAREYLQKRNVTLDTVKRFHLGFSPDEWDALLTYLRSQKISPAMMEKAGLVIPRDKKEGHYDRFRNRIIFPIIDSRQHYIAFGARTLEQETDTAKYINSPETPVYVKGQHLYGLNFAKDAVVKEDLAVIVEGYMDCVIPHQAGVTHVIASLGTALTLEQIRLLGRYTKNIVMLFDADEAGEAALMRSLDLLVEEGMNVKVASLTPGDDPDSFIRLHGPEAFVKRILDAKTLFDYKLEVLKKYFDARTVEGKAHITHQMMGTITKFADENLRSGYRDKLAKSIFVSEHVIETEEKKILTSHKKHDINHGQTKKTSVQEYVLSLEYSLLHLLLHDGTFISPTKEAVGIDEFQDKNVRNVIAKIYELLEQGEVVSTSSLMRSFEDQEVHQLISQLAVDKERLIGDKTKMHSDFLERMKKNRLKTMRQDLLHQIKEAESTNDHHRLEELKEKFNLLIKT